MTKWSDIKSCPFCGGVADTYHEGRRWWVKCKRCNCMTNIRNSEEEAIKLWNERIGKTAKMTLQRKFLAGEDVYDVFCECGAHVGEFVIEDDDISDIPTHCVHCDRRLVIWAKY